MVGTIVLYMLSCGLEGRNLPENQTLWKIPDERDLLDQQLDETKYLNVTRNDTLDYEDYVDPEETYVVEKLETMGNDLEPSVEENLKDQYEIVHPIMLPETHLPQNNASENIVDPGFDGTRFEHPVVGEFVPDDVRHLLKEHENRDIDEETRNHLARNEKCRKCQQCMDNCFPECLLRTESMSLTLVDADKTNDTATPKKVDNTFPTTNDTNTCRFLLLRTHESLRFLTASISALLVVLVFGLILAGMKITHLNRKLREVTPYRQVNNIYTFY